MMRSITDSQLEKARLEWGQQLGRYLQTWGVPPRYLEAKFDEGLICPEALVWIKTREVGGSLVLGGRPGSGKTMTAVWCLRQVHKNAAYERSRELGVNSSAHWPESLPQNQG